MPVENITQSTQAYYEYGRDATAALGNLLKGKWINLYKNGKSNSPTWIVSESQALSAPFHIPDHTYRLKTRPWIDRYVGTPGVYGYFYGGGWAFGLTESDNFKIMSGNYDRYISESNLYASTGVPREFTVVYQDIRTGRSTMPWW